MSTNPKRMLLVLGGKGGVGKTLFCRLLFFYFNQAKANFAAFDADRENPELHTLHANCEPAVQLFDFLDVNQTKLFLGYLEESQPEIVFLDMPAASSHGVREQFERFDLLNMAMDPSLGYRITVVGVLNHSYHAIGSLSEMMEAFGERADYVTVLSEMWIADGHNFELWHDSEDRKLFEKLKGIEVKMPLLELSSLHALHRQNLPFERAGELTVGDRIIIRSFLNRTRALFDPAAAYLALPSWMAGNQFPLSRMRLNRQPPNQRAARPNRPEPSQLLLPNRAMSQPQPRQEVLHEITSPVSGADG